MRQEPSAEDGNDFACLRLLLISRDERGGVAGGRAPNRRLSGAQRETGLGGLKGEPERAQPGVGSWLGLNRTFAHPETPTTPVKGAALLSYRRAKLGTRRGMYTSDSGGWD